MTKTTLLKAIKAKCLECSGALIDVKRCPQKTCNLHNYRISGPRKDPSGKILPEFRKALVRATIKRHCYECVGWELPGDITPTKLCTSPKCPLFDYRAGTPLTDHEKQLKKDRTPGEVPPKFRAWIEKQREGHLKG